MGCAHSQVIPASRPASLSPSPSLRIQQCASLSLSPGREASPNKDKGASKICLSPANKLSSLFERNDVSEVDSQEKKRTEEDRNLCRAPSRRFSDTGPIFDDKNKPLLEDNSNVLPDPTFTSSSGEEQIKIRQPSEALAKPFEDQKEGCVDSQNQRKLDESGDQQFLTGPNNQFLKTPSALDSNRGLGRILECESHLEVSFRGEEEVSKLSQRLSITSKAPMKPAFGFRQSYCKEKIQGNLLLPVQSESSDSEISEHSQKSPESRKLDIKGTLFSIQKEKFLKPQPSRSSEQLCRVSNPVKQKSIGTNFISTQEGLNSANHLNIKPRSAQNIEELTKNAQSWDSIR